ncbi:MAG: DUF2752 domain-containing protein [Bacteroidia bacterium]
MFPLFFRKKIAPYYLAVLLLIPPVLLILPATFFDKGQSICLSVLLFKQTCFGCGLTRGIQHLLHFDFAAASAYNKMSFVVLPMIILGWALEVKRVYGKIKKPSDKGRL